MKKFEIQPGNEIRGMMIRLYPTKEQEELLLELMDDQRRAWNWLVNQTEVTLRAREAYALKRGLVPARPERPNYDGLTPEESKATRETHWKNCAAWGKAVHDATNKLPECRFYSFKELLEHYGCKHDYQLLSKVIGWAYEGDRTQRIRPGAHTLQALTKNYFTRAEGMRRKKFRRKDDDMPLQVRSGDCFVIGDFGSRRGSTTFYNCQVKFNGLKLLGRLPGKAVVCKECKEKFATSDKTCRTCGIARGPRAPEGRVLEGVTIRREADGWWGSIKQEVPIRVLPASIPGSIIGIDVGLDYIAAMSDGTRVPNTRGKEYAERIAGRQAQKKPVGRLHLAAKRNAKHEIMNKVVKPLATVETIKLEQLSSKIGQMGSSKMSVMRSIAFALRQRYGTRVREVPPHYTSQDCSQCGVRSKESWSYAHGRYGECPSCGYRQDRDINAARNIAAKDPIPLVS